VTHKDDYWSFVRQEYRAQKYQRISSWHASVGSLKMQAVFLQNGGTPHRLHGVITQRLQNESHTHWNFCTSPMDKSNACMSSVCVCVYAYVCINVFYIYIYIYIYIYMSLCMHISVCVCVCVDFCIYVYIRVNVFYTVYMHSRVRDPMRWFFKFT
jgi:hypothetical protein